MSDLRAVPLSVLDLAPVSAGSSANAALHASIELARHAEQLGCRRFWFAEHHNMQGVGSSAPAVLIAAAAGATERIRVGSGGVMLPNHAPLVVAEQFGTLDALYPGRIDLGIGRAPGTDPVTAAALRRSAAALSADDFPQQLGELRAFLRGAFPDGHPYRQIVAMPGGGEEGEGPPLWLLGSSDYSAQVAGLLGLPFGFAHHFSAANTVPALDLYRRSFRPSERLARPYALVAVQVVCGGDDDEGRRLADPAALSFARRLQGLPSRLPSPEEAAAHTWSAFERRVREERQYGQAIGGPETVRRTLAGLLQATGADELMVTTLVHDPADRLLTLERVCRMFGEAAPGTDA